MELTKLILIVLGIIGIIILIPVLLLVITTSTVTHGERPGPEPVEGGPHTTGLLVRGAACEQDSDCVYATNAYPYLRCTSGNCPPEDDPDQPVQGDPAYEWIESYREECVNAGAMEHVNSNGEELLPDVRGPACACRPYANGDGNPTSLDGQKICTRV